MYKRQQYIPDQFAGREFKAASVTQAKVSTKLYKTSSSDPAETDDTGLGYAVGTIWTNTTSGQVFICSDASAEDAVWYGQEGDIINEPFKVQGSNYGWTAGGVADYFPGGAGVNFQTRWSFASDIGSGTDWGDLVTNHAHANTGSARSETEAFVVGGYVPHGAGYVDTISKYVFATPGNATDAGEWIAGAFQDVTSAPDGANTFIMGGTGPPGVSDTVTKMSMTSPYPQSDNGELSASRYAGAGASCLLYTSPSPRD